MAIRLPSYLHRNRHGMLYFRLTIPPEYRPYIGVSELYRSLGTASVREASPIAQSLYSALRRVFSTIDASAMPEHKKTPHRPLPIDPERLQETLRYAKERHRLIDRIEELEQADINHHLQRVQKQQQHDRELDLVMRAVASATPVVPPATPMPMPPAAHIIPTTATTTPPALSAITPASHTPTSKLLSEAIEQVIASKKARGKWTEKTEAENRAIYGLLLRIIEDRAIAEIGNREVTSYINTLRNLPANMNKMPQFIGKSIDEVLAMKPEPMSLRTINKHIERASSLFKLVLRDPANGATHNPFEGQTVEAKKSSDEKRREPFDGTELSALLSHQAFKERKFNNPYAFWSIPLAMFTGARLNEIAQLHLNDFVELEGVKCIDINDDDSEDGEDSKRLKTKNARRLVPIHDELLRLGIWEYVQALKAAGYTRLFPEIKKRRDGYGATISSWFQRHREKCGISEKHTKVFHSFRHAAITTLLDAETPMEQVAPLVGHETGIVTGDVYWNKKDAAKRKRTVSKLVYPAEVIAMMPSIRDVTLNVYGHGTFWAHGKIVNRLFFD